jgi:ADP-heptose:LPS heptosyltransferase
MLDESIPNTPNAEPKRLLAVNFGGIGDEILFLPTLATIKKYFPSWHITLLVEPRSASIGQVTDLVDTLITFDIKKRPLMASDLLDLVGLIRNGNYDLVVSSGSSPQVAALLFLSGIPQRIGYGSNLLARRLLTHPIPLNKAQYAAGMYHDLVKGLGIEEKYRNPQIKLNNESRRQIKSLLGEGKKSRVVLHPGTSKLAIIKRIFKTWPAKDWANLIELLLRHGNIEVILAGGPDDHEPVEDIIKALNSRGITEQTENFVLAHGKTKSLTELGALIEAADLLVCVDSAPMHMAVGLNKRTVALFAVTDPKKLLPQEEHFVFLTSSSPGELAEPSPASAQDHCPPGVVLPAENVLQSVLDQLSLSSSQGRSPERCG